MSCFPGGPQLALDSSSVPRRDAPVTAPDTRAADLLREAVGVAEDRAAGAA